MRVERAVHELIPPHGGVLQEVAAETSGCNPLVIWEDADLGLALNAVMSSLVNNEGQTCSHLGNLIVHAAVEDQFIDMLKKRLDALRYGDVTNMLSEELNECGAIVSKESVEGHKSALRRLVRDCHAEVVYTKTIPERPDAYDFAPTLLRVDPDLWRNDAVLLNEWRSSEFFCMALSYTTVRSREEMKQVCEAGIFKLTGGICTESPGIARYFIEKGRCGGNRYVNRGITGALVGRAFGGDAISGSSGSGIGASTLFSLARYVSQENITGFIPSDDFLEWGSTVSRLERTLSFTPRTDELLFGKK